MIILGIDTSCDDTCIAILKSKTQNQKSKIIDFEILSNVVSSQVKLHTKYGGVYPMLAKREHRKNLPVVLKKALKEAKAPKIDLIAVTSGPGLEPCLWEGINFAQELSEKLKKPLIPINHIEGHILANFVGSNYQLPITNYQKLFPAVCLVVSGGHTEIILMKDIGKYESIGGTRDDAAGECFDKVARILGLGYPGGPIVAEQAEKLKTKNYQLITKLPRPMITQKNYDFSFSGLKTAVLYKVKSDGYKTKNKKYIQEMCAEAQQAIIDVLIHKTIKAAKDYRVKSIILGGGVAANEKLRSQFKLKIENSKLKIDFMVPPKNLCTDNAAMIAITAFFNNKKGNLKNWKKIEADGNLRI